MIKAMEAVIFSGTQGAGKSTFYQKRFSSTHVRINLDMLRTRHRERVLLDACLRMKQSFVVDNTNPTAADRARYVAPARAAGFRVVAYYFPPAVEAAIERNAARTGRARVPSHVIASTASRLEVPCHEEGFDAVFVVTAGEGGAFLLRDLPPGASSGTRSVCLE